MRSPGDLTAVEEVTQTPGTPSLTDVQPVENQIAPGASKALNPDISVVGTFLAHAGDTNELEERAPAELDEVEVAFEAFIDPYAKGRFFIAVTPGYVKLDGRITLEDVRDHWDEIRNEEGYVVPQNTPEETALFRKYLKQDKPES